MPLAAKNCSLLPHFWQSKVQTSNPGFADSMRVSSISELQTDQFGRSVGRLDTSRSLVEARALPCSLSPITAKGTRGDGADYSADGAIASHFSGVVF